jgi:hypothetical protein
VVGEQEYLFDSVRDLGLVADVARVKRSVMVALNDVKDGYSVTACDQGIYDVTTEKTAAADDEERVGVHDRMKDKWAHSIFPFPPDATT